MTTLLPAITGSSGITSFIPLTAEAQPDYDCSTMFILGPPLLAFDSRYPKNIGPGVTCVPSAVSISRNNFRGFTTTSLGPLACPGNWYTATSRTLNQSSTFAMCCPSDYYAYDYDTFTETDDAEAISNIQNGACFSFLDTSTLAYATWSIKSGSSSWYINTTTVSPYAAVYADAIFGWNVRAPTPTPTTTETVSTPTSPASTASARISAGAAAGIGVGVGLGVIAIASLLLTFFFMRRRKMRTLAETPQIHQDHGVMFEQRTPNELPELALAAPELHDAQSGLQVKTPNLEQY
ncbi:uncharacterized protein F4822DRAFT_446047 [Hypoxylon trugodes]|uniref:uncharacterized protein n=1 Tax=Hypoxylon trugodes TaxID=326681 RepID=UPI0021929621|nr:uncharacterized protein F4822DRAFT_446047 [Hypoxylon trugodes]KAI1384892.1 hypothetical protein F4822DRAFT_446047 [Hypoxylon trugodes]